MLIVWFGCFWGDFRVLFWFGLLGCGVCLCLLCGVVVCLVLSSIDWLGWLCVLVWVYGLLLMVWLGLFGCWFWCFGGLGVGLFL